MVLCLPTMGFCVYRIISLMHLKSIRWFYLERGDLLPSVQNIPLKTMQPLLQAMSHSYMLNMHFFRWTGSTQKWGQWFCLYELCGFVSTNYVVLCLLTMWFCAYQLCGFVFTNYVVLCPLFMSFWNLTLFCILLFPLFQSFLSPLIMWFCAYQLCVFCVYQLCGFCVYQLCGFVSIVYEFLKFDTCLYFIVSFQCVHELCGFASTNYVV